MSLPAIDLIMIASVGFNPTDAEIEREMIIDKQRNPHGDAVLPRRRDRMEIIVDYKIEAARMLLRKLEG